MRLSVFAMLIVLLASGDAWAQPNFGRIAGTVSHANVEEAVPGASVRLLSNGEETRATIADMQGGYQFDSLPAGNYAVYVSFIGATGDYRDVVLRAGEEVILDLNLGFRVTEEDIEHGRQEAREDLSRGVKLIRTLAGWGVVVTGDYPCFEEEQTILSEVAERLYELRYVEVYSDYDEVPDEVLWARVKGYNDEVEHAMTQRHGTGWKENLWRTVGQETYRQHPECFD